MGKVKTGHALRRQFGQWKTAAEVTVEPGQPHNWTWRDVTEFLDDETAESVRDELNLLQRQSYGTIPKTLKYTGRAAAQNALLKGQGVTEGTRNAVNYLNPMTWKEHARSAKGLTDSLQRISAEMTKPLEEGAIDPEVIIGDIQQSGATLRNIGLDAKALLNFPMWKDTISKLLHGRRERALAKDTATAVERAQRKKRWREGDLSTLGRLKERMTEKRRVQRAVRDAQGEDGGVALTL